MVLPPDVRAALVEALGAYIARAETLDLPKNLRRLKGFRPKALARHGDELLELLEDETQRKLVLQALDDGELRPSKRNETALRIALDRTDGWEAKLAALSEMPEETDTKSGRDIGKELERERRKVKDAREEARRAKAAARAELEKSSRGVVELQRALDTTRAELERARAEIEAAASETSRVTGALERRERRAQREVERARAASNESRSETKSLRKEIARLTRELADASVAGRPRRAPSVAQPIEPKVRSPLGVPKGLLAESREALDLWLKEPNVSLLVDGYNVSKTEGGFGDLSLEHQRNRLVDEIDRLARMRKVPSTIVFDGALIEPASVRRKRRTVVVAYSRPPEIADDHLVALLEERPNHPVIVVTNDRELQAKSVALGATIARAEQLLELIR
ncbi:MAG: NYN domain-containing protein [Actinomycetota bacterium]